MEKFSDDWTARERIAFDTQWHSKWSSSQIMEYLWLPVHERLSVSSKFIGDPEYNRNDDGRMEAIFAKTIY